MARNAKIKARKRIKMYHSHSRGKKRLQEFRKRKEKVKITLVEGKDFTNSTAIRSLPDEKSLSNETSSSELNTETGKHHPFIIKNVGPQEKAVSTKLYEGKIVDSKCH